LNSFDASPESGDRREHEKVAIVIGTFAAVPYVHLQLEARRRLHPHIPALIHDDGSMQASELKALAESYGADLVTLPCRMRHSLGDLNVYPTAFRWCAERGVRYLLKVSRRWLWQVDWTSDLLSVFDASGAPTVSNYTISYAFGFRTECVAFDLKYWMARPFFDDVDAKLQVQRHVFVENYIHVWAQRFSDEAGAKWREWQQANPVPCDRSGYAPWNMMGTCRHERIPSRLWHNANSPEEYAELAQSWGLSYPLELFLDPNAGQGLGEEPLS